MTTLMLALKLTILFALAGLATLGLWRGRAAARHLVWGLALAGAIALPLLGSVSPRVELAVLPVDETPVTAMEVVSPAVVADVGKVKAVAPATPILTTMPARTTRADVPWLLVGWVAGSAILLLLVLASVLATARLARRTTPILSGVLRAELDDCRAALCIRRPVRLLLSHDRVMPMTWGAWRPSIVLPAAATDWSPERRRDVLLHELAHVRRLDWLSQLGARFVCAAYWWHPLAWYAAQRLREERELACDDLVLIHGTNAADYAHHLLAIAKDLRASPATALAAVAMARPSQLASRLLAVLDVTRRRSGVSRTHAGAAVTAAAALILPLAGLTAVAASPGHTTDPIGDVPTTTWNAPASLSAPTLVASTTLCRWDGSGERSSSHSNIDDDRVTIRFLLNDCEMSVRSRGLVRFSDDERDVAELGLQAWFEIEERGSGSARRRAEFERRDGSIVRRFYVDGREAAWDGTAQAWFQSAMLVVFRRSSFQARERVARLYARGGGQAVLAEVEHLYSNSALTIYLSFYGERERVSSAEARRIAQVAGERISSSSGLSTVLTTLLRNPGLDNATRAAIVDATTRISSSSARATVLVAAVEYEPLTTQLADAVLRSAGDISSSSARGQVLTTVGAHLPANTALPASYIDAARGISSSSTLGAVLITLLQRDRLTDDRVAGVLDLAGGISSSSERVRVLEALLAQHRLTDRTRTMFFAVADGISSSSGKGTILRTVIAGRPDAATLELVLAHAGSVSSSSERAAVLVAAAEAGLVITPALRATYERTANSISSRSERERALRALGLRET